MSQRCSSVKPRLPASIRSWLCITNVLGRGRNTAPRRTSKRSKTETPKAFCNVRGPWRWSILNIDRAEMGQQHPLPSDKHSWNTRASSPFWRTAFFFLFFRRLMTIDGVVCCFVFLFLWGWEWRLKTRRPSTANACSSIKDWDALMPASVCKSVKLAHCVTDSVVWVGCSVLRLAQCLFRCQWQHLGGQSVRGCVKIMCLKARHRGRSVTC